MEWYVLCLMTLTDLQTRRAGLSASADLIYCVTQICIGIREYLLRRRGCLAVCYTPVLYQNG